MTATPMPSLSEYVGHGTSWCIGPGSAHMDQQADAKHAAARQHWRSVPERMWRDAQDPPHPDGTAPLARAFAESAAMARR